MQISLFCNAHMYSMTTTPLLCMLTVHISETDLKINNVDGLTPPLRLKLLEDGFFHPLQFLHPFMNLTPTQQKKKNTLIKHTVIRLCLGFTVESRAVSMSCCVSGKGAGQAEVGPLLSVRTRFPGPSARR